MVGGAGKKLLRITAAEAQIANLIPPIVNGKDFVQDPDAAVRFDKAQLKRRIDMLHGFVAEAGRAPGSVEVSGIAMVNISRSKSEADAAVKAVGSAMGFPSEETTRNAPVLLIGTPEEVRRELRSRIEEFGMTYYIVFPRSEESRDLLVREIMPEFTPQGGTQ
jgi:alkanesulfonate monooxygenase SsuD/methylene tetrahydromethanopterin reductase-like flavin-dependent oxidoreductase (luciferase family)